MSYPVRLQEPRLNNVCAQKELNFHQRIRNPLFYPLNYGRPSACSGQAMWDIITQELNLRRFEGDFVAEPLAGFVDEGIGGFDEGDFVAYFFDDFFALSRI